MKRKILILLLTFVMILGAAFCFAGCSKTDNEQPNGTKPGTNQTEEDPKGNEEDENGGNWTPVIPFSE